MSGWRRQLASAGLLLGACWPAAAGSGAPRRVVALAPHLAELTCAVGACERLVGAVAYSDFPASVAALPKVGDAYAIQYETLVALRPDLVLAWHAGTPADTVSRLRGLGLTVREIDITRLEAIAEALLTLGGWLDVETEADKAAAAFRARLAALAEAHRGRAPVSVLYQLEAGPIFTVNRDSPISEAIALCGGVNAFADLPRRAGSLSPEALIARDPQVVVFGEQDDTAGIRRFWARFPRASASRAGTLYAVDADRLSRATPRVLEGAENLCALLDDARARLARASGERHQQQQRQP